MNGFARAVMALTLAGLAAPAAAGAPVSVPIEWDELDDPDLELTIDVERRTIAAPAVGIEATFPLDDFTRMRLLEGLDDIGLTLRHADDVLSGEVGDDGREQEAGPGRREGAGQSGQACVHVGGLVEEAAEQQDPGDGRDAVEEAVRTDRGQRVPGRAVPDAAPSGVSPSEHEAHHRGQIIAEIRATGGEPPYTDW